MNWTFSRFSNVVRFFLITVWANAVVIEFIDTLGNIYTNGITDSIPIISYIDKMVNPPDVEAELRILLNDPALHTPMPYVILNVGTHDVYDVTYTPSMFLNE
ncbi:MAG: hypothetical protein ACKKL6_01970 [Candidatus Komeilibacteria bacterium]